jgi:hypothetical protein
MVTTVSLRFGSVDAATTKVHVTYARTALSPEGEPHVRAMSESDKKAGAEWQSAIDKFLAAQTVPAH